MISEDTARAWLNYLQTATPQADDVNAAYFRGMVRAFKIVLEEDRSQPGEIEAHHEEEEEEA